MHRHRFPNWLLITTLLLARPLGVLADADVPQEVAGYYRDYNYINLYTRPAERQAFYAAHSLSPEDLREGLFTSSRARRLGALMHKAVSKIQYADEQMVYVSGDVDTERALLWQLASTMCRKELVQQLMACHLRYESKKTLPFVYASELIDIDVAKRVDRTLHVSVRVYRLPETVNLRLIGEYDRSSEPPPDPDGISEPPDALALSAPRTEVHEWILENGVWMKREGGIVYTGYPSPIADQYP